MLAVQTFIGMSTQWRVGAAGAVGLDYNVLRSIYDTYGGSPDGWPDTFESIRVLEDGALTTMNKIAERERKKRGANG